MTDVTTTAAWRRLGDLRASFTPDLRGWFAADPDRARTFTRDAGEGAWLGVAAERPTGEPDDCWAVESGRPPHGVHRRVPVAVAAGGCRGVDNVSVRRGGADVPDVAHLPGRGGNVLRLSGPDLS